MSRFSIVFERPLYLLLLIPAAAVIVLPFLRLPKNRRKIFKRIAPVVLHLLISALLVSVISGMKFVSVSSDRTVIILMDVSDSMGDELSAVQEKTDAILSLMDGDAHVGVAAFGDGCVLLVNPQDESRSVKNYATGSNGTDIAGALEFAQKRFPEDESARVILLSDGKETGGGAESMAAYLATCGVEVDVMLFDTSVTAAEMQLVSLTSEESCYAGDIIDFTAELEANMAGPVELTLYDDGVAVSTVSAEVTEGTNLITLSAAASSAGRHSYCLELTSLYDTMEENNCCYTGVTVNGAESILIVAEKLQDAELLAELLSGSGSEVATVTSRNLPTSVIELCGYDEVILLNVNADDLPSGADSLLESYVSVYGRTLLAVGGTGTFQYGSMKATAFEEFLPVEFELKDSDNADSVALMLVLDCSMSMSNNSKNLNLAKQGAVKVVESMSDNDYVGIISFNSTAVLQAGLTQATDINKESLTRVVSQLSTQRGTYYTAAMQLAYDELMKSDAPVRHVIFLSDGNASDGGFLDVEEEMVEEGITVTTIGLGYSSSTLSYMAELGSGRYYYVSSVNDLPDIMLSETEQVVVNSLIEEDTEVCILKEDAVTSGISEEALPNISGYIGLTAGEDATVLLSTEDDRPILTVCDYGRGTAAVLSTDLTGNWSSKWFGSLAGQLLIRNICTELIDLKDRQSSLQAEIEADGFSIYMSVLTSGTREGDSVYVTIATPSGDVDMKLLSDGSGIYTGELELAESGNYSIVFLQKNAEDENVDYLITSLAVNYSSEYDAFREDGETVLRNIAELTGGILSDSPEVLANRTPSGVALTKDPALLFGTVAIVLLLSDIAIRKLRLKDLKFIDRGRGGRYNAG